MYEFSKIILEKVSFDRALFRKELRKALKWIKPREKKLLKKWCISSFGRKYRSIINNAFKNIIR